MLLLPLSTGYERKLKNERSRRGCTVYDMGFSMTSGPERRLIAVKFLGGIYCEKMRVFGRLICTLRQLRLPPYRLIVSTAVHCTAPYDMKCLCGPHRRGTLTALR